MYRKDDSCSCCCRNSEKFRHEPLIKQTKNSFELSNQFRIIIIKSISYVSMLKINSFIHLLTLARAVNDLSFGFYRTLTFASPRRPRSVAYSSPRIPYQQTLISRWCAPRVIVAPNRGELGASRADAETATALPRPARAYPSANRGG